MRNKRTREESELVEICLFGDLTDTEGDLCEKLLEVPIGGECTIYFNSPGGSPYTAISLMTLLAIRKTRATGIVTGECSSSALWPFAACTRRIVTPYSYLLFHPLKSQSDEHMNLDEAAEWSRHITQLESEMDQALIRMFDADADLIQSWMKPGRYVGGLEFHQAGLAEFAEFEHPKVGDA